MDRSQMPKTVTGEGISLLNAKLEIEKTGTDDRININKPEEMFLFTQEKNLLKKWLRT